MKINELLYGFRIKERDEIAAVGGVLYMMEHEKSGARLAYLEREDACRTFAITFGTLPTDDTGVFHILEHSVLCGSRKFPTKEPFTELLKGSLNTFLNAMTYNDKTSYPLSSRNDKDFYNLVDVYMDAVLHPSMLECENIFRQEGWRYEINDGAATVNGVVYSEMKGAYSSVDELADYHLSRLMYPGGTYSYDSGGNPSAIPTLTYEDFKGAHKKFYRPDNAYIFLDGKPRLDEILPLLDGYLSEYERGEFEYVIERGGDVITEPLSVEFEASESDGDKSRLYLAYPAFGVEESVKLNALSAVRDAIADTNEAPLKKKLLESGLCEDAVVWITSGARWASLNVEFRGVKADEELRLRDYFDNAVQELLRDGIDTTLIEASIDRAEFKAREADYGSYPRGIVNLLALNDGWLFGIHPRDIFDYEPIFSALREKLCTGYYQSVLSEVLSLPRATLILKPSSSLAERREEEDGAKMRALYESLSDAERRELAARAEEFSLWQSTPDTPEALATLPRLEVSDLGEGEGEIPTVKCDKESYTVLTHPIVTSGISYLELYFDASDTKTEDVPLLALLGSVYPNLDTGLGTANDFRRRTKSALGSLTLSTYQTAHEGEPKLYLVVKLSCLDRKRDEATELLSEFMFGKIINNTRAIKHTLTQLVTSFSDMIAESGHSFAIMRGAARYSRQEALKEYTTGYEFYRAIKALSHLSGDGLSELALRLEELRNRIFVKSRLLVSLTAENDGGFTDRAVRDIPNGTPSGRSEIQTLPRQSEGIAVPSRVCYAVLSSNLECGGVSQRSGAWATLATIYNYEILWEQIRVMGGAYGTGFLSRGVSRTLAFYSYRDPSPARTLSIFRDAPRLIRERLGELSDIDKYIIGTVGSLEPVTTPATDGSDATVLYLAGKSHEDVIRSRKEAISATPEVLSELSERLDKALLSATATVVGSRAALAELGLDVILEV